MCTSKPFIECKKIYCILQQRPFAGFAGGEASRGRHRRGDLACRSPIRRLSGGRHSMGTDGGRHSVGTELSIAIAHAGCRRRRLDAATKIELLEVETSLALFVTVALSEQHLQALSMIRMYGPFARWMISLQAGLEGVLKRPVSGPIFVWTFQDSQGWSNRAESCGRASRFDDSAIYAPRRFDDSTIR